MLWKVLSTPSQAPQPAKVLGGLAPCLLCEHWAPESPKRYKSYLTALSPPLSPWWDACPELSRYVPRKVHSNDGHRQSNLRCAWTSLEVSKSRLSIFLNETSQLPESSLGLFKGLHYTKCQLGDDNCLFQSQELLLQQIKILTHSK